jgi:ubiquitin-conjugating enzyme E2 J2
MWSISTILRGLYSFMVETSPTLGSIETSTATKRKLAAASLEYNVKNDSTFCKLFPEFVKRYEEEMRRKQEQAGASEVTTPRAIVTTKPSHAAVAGLALNMPQTFMAAVAGFVAILSIVMAIRFI